jgi:hypothetical protein
VSPVKYEMGFYIPEDGILHSHCRENLKSYIVGRLFHIRITYVFPTNVFLMVSHLQDTFFPLPIEF